MDFSIFLNLNEFWLIVRVSSMTWD